MCRIGNQMWRSRGKYAWIGRWEHNSKEINFRLKWIIIIKRRWGNWHARKKYRSLKKATALWNGIAYRKN